MCIFGAFDDVAVNSTRFTTICPLPTTIIILCWCILQVIRSHGVNPSTDQLSAIDYFSTGQTNGAQISSNAQRCNGENDDQVDCEMENAASGVKGKRKLKHVKRDVKMKKKKSKKDQMDVGGNYTFLDTKTFYRECLDSRQYWLIRRSLMGL